LSLLIALWKFGLLLVVLLAVQEKTQQS
jgi:hypothetical protein